MVLVPMFLPGIPCASLPISFPNENFHLSFNRGCLIRCLYSSNSPVSVSRTDPAKSHRKVSGYLRRDVWRAVGQFPDISTAANSASCLERLVRRKFGGVFSSSSMTFGPLDGLGCVTRWFATWRSSQPKSDSSGIGLTCFGS